MTRQSPAKSAVRAMNRARLEPGVTCGASRHVAMIAEILEASISGKITFDEPHHVAASLAAVAGALFEARHALAVLAPEPADGAGWWWTTRNGKAHLLRMAALNVDRKEVAP